MIGLVRAADTLRHAGAWPRHGAGGGQGLQTRRSRRFGDQAGSPDQERGRAGRQIRRDAANRRRCRLQAQRFPHRPANPRADRRHRARKTAATGCGWPAPSSRSGRKFQRADLPAGARLDRGLHRLSARRQCRRGGRCAGRARPRDVRAQAVAPGAGRAAAVARPARSRRRARPIREDARRARFPAARLHRRFRLARRRAPASSSPRISPSAPTSRRSWRWPAATSRRCRRKASSFASTA